MRIIAQLLIALTLSATSLASTSLYEQVQVELIAPYAKGKPEFIKAYKSLLKKYKKERCVVLKATVLSFKLSRKEIADLIEITCDCSVEKNSKTIKEDPFDSKSVIDSKDAKYVIEPPKVSNPLDYDIRFPDVFPIPTPPVSTPETKTK